MGDRPVPKLTRLTRASNGSMAWCKGYKEFAMIDMGVPRRGALRGKKEEGSRSEAFLNSKRTHRLIWRHLLIPQQTVLGVMSLQIRLPPPCKWVRSCDLLQPSRTILSGTTEWVILDNALSGGDCILKCYCPVRVKSLLPPPPTIQYSLVTFWTWTAVQFASLCWSSSNP